MEMQKANNKSRIKVSEYIAPIISSRDAVDVLKNAIIKAKTRIVELDFSDISLISRSAAHELLIMKEDLARRLFFRKKNVEFVNTNELISEMLRIVASNRAIPKKNAPEFHSERTDMESVLKKIAV